MTAEAQSAAWKEWLAVAFSTPKKVITRENHEKCLGHARDCTRQRIVFPHRNAELDWASAKCSALGVIPMLPGDEIPPGQFYQVGYTRHAMSDGTVAWKLDDDVEIVEEGVDPATP